MTEAELQKIISILDGPIPGKMATCKQIHDHSVQYHKCAGSLLDEVVRLRAEILEHRQKHQKWWGEMAEGQANAWDRKLWEALETK